MARLQDSVRVLTGVGPQMAQKLSRLGVNVLSDLLYLYPRRYSDRTNLQKISETILYDYAAIAVMVLTPPKVSHIRQGLDLLKIRVGDETGVMEVTFFNQSFLKSKLIEGTEVVLYGKVEGDMVRRTMSSPECEFVDEEHYQGKFLPIYPLTAGISQKQMRRLVSTAVSEVLGEILETFPEILQKKYSLIDRAEALKWIHLPENQEQLKEARRRLAFEELFCLQIGLLKLGSHHRKARGIPFNKEVDLTTFTRHLPFQLTEGQREAIFAAAADMKSGAAMNRLIQGDVGCGKTVVAAALIYLCAQNGCQAAMMAPTELLATQHYESLAPLLENCGLRTALVTGSVSAAQKRKVAEELVKGEIDFAIGTQALIQRGIDFKRLGLVIVDEQHRFGVNQRALLTNKGENPHLLVMSATPIPRTLALMIYGDLDISVIRTMPAGRQKIDTTLIGEKKRKTLYSFLRGQVEQGRQIYVVCPLIEEDEEGESDLHSAEHTYRQLSEKMFPDLRVALIHGRMKSAEKDEVMSAFAEGNIDLLVSTTVIEVGINVPNATVMVIENAERFGLSQLHQLRGRVGRGVHRSYCILISENESEKTKERLYTLVSTNDGFAIAEADLVQRGPGDFFGAAQHGLPTLRLATLTTDTQMIEVAAKEANFLLESDPALERVPALREEVDQLFALDKGNFLN